MKKVLVVLSAIFILTIAMATVAYATGTPAAPSPTNSVSQVIIDSVEPVKTQAKEIFFNVVVWAARAITVIVLFVFIAMAGISKHNNESVNITRIVVAFVILIILIVIPEAIWQLIG